MAPGFMAEYLIYTAPVDSPMSLDKIKEISGYLEKKYLPPRTPSLMSLAPASWLPDYRPQFQQPNGLSKSGCGT